MVNIVCDTGCEFDTSFCVAVESCIGHIQFSAFKLGGTGILAIYPRRRNAVSSTGFFWKMYIFGGLILLVPPHINLGAGWRCAQEKLNGNVGKIYIGRQKK